MLGRFDVPALRLVKIYTLHRWRIADTPRSPLSNIAESVCDALEVIDLDGFDTVLQEDIACGRCMPLNPLGSLKIGIQS